jgi:peroxiredoxin Q/BCP
VLGASFDTPEENRAFAEAESFNFRLLSDTDRTVGGRYEVVRPSDDQYADYPMRVAYLIDPEGTIRRAVEVTDVEGFAGMVLADIAGLRGGEKV